MKGIVFPGDGTAQVKDFPIPEPGYGEVVIKIRASGMCGSDLHMYHGNFEFDHNMVAGHEPAGDIYQVGDGIDESVAKPGDRVLVHHYWGCGTCRRCREGWAQMCENMNAKTLAVSAHGGHEEYMCVPVATIAPLPEGLSYPVAASLSCGTTTAWGAIKRAGGVEDTTTVIFGMGPIGQAATMFAQAMGARVIAVDVDDNRLAQAKEHGAALTINSRTEDLEAKVKEFTRGRKAEVVLETSGRASNDIFTVLGTFGHAVLVGLPGPLEMNMQQMYKNQWTVCTSWTASWQEMQRAAQFIVDHQLPMDDIFSHSWTVDQAQAAYEWFSKQDAGKGVFIFD